MLDDKIIRKAISDMMWRAENRLPKDVLFRLREMHDVFERKSAKRHLDIAERNYEAAQADNVFYCKVDTGIPIFHVRPSKNLALDIEKIIGEEVEAATAEGRLKAMMIDPFSGEWNETNNGPYVPFFIYGPPAEGYTEVTFFPGSAGAEKLATLTMVKPPISPDDVTQIVLDTVREGGGKPCQPIIVGVGIGGSADMAMMLSKKALLRPLGEKNDDDRMSGLEDRMFTEINVDGLGVNATAIGVHIEYALSHRANCPVAVSMLCRAARRETVRIWDSGKVEIVEHD